MLHLLEVYAEVYVETNPIQESSYYQATLKIQSLNPDNIIRVASVKTPMKNSLPSVIAFNPPQVVSYEGFTQQLDLPMSLHNASTFVRVRVESDESIIMLHFKPIAKLVDRAVGEYREDIAVEPAIHARFDQSVYWNTGKKAIIGYSIYSNNGGEFEWYLSAVRRPENLFSAEGGFEFKEKKVLESGWNHFTVESLRK